MVTEENGLFLIFVIPGLKVLATSSLFINIRQRIDPSYLSKSIMLFPIILILLSVCIPLTNVMAYHEPSHYIIGDENHTQTDTSSESPMSIGEYNKTLVAAYTKYKEKVARIWGNESVLPDKTIGVTYRDNLSQRSVINFEKGTIKIEMALRDYNSKMSDIIKSKLATAIEQTILQGPDERSIIDIAQNPDPPKSDKPSLLEGLIANLDGKPLTPIDMQKFKELNTQKLSERELVGTDGNSRVVISTQFKMVPDHIRLRARKFRRQVDRSSQDHHIPSPLIYAIIETESMFNPMAKSPVPAFGLMQLVPSTGARDAYKYLYEEDRVVKDTYLYNPRNNIELGVAYLHLLYFKYLDKIKNPLSRQWAMVAAYNAGVQNVIQSFSGKYNRKKFSSRWTWKAIAIERINKLDSDQVYKHLRRSLPAKETRAYVRKVHDRMSKYGIKVLGDNSEFSLSHR